MKHHRIIAHKIMGFEEVEDIKVEDIEEGGEGPTTQASTQRDQHIIATPIVIYQHHHPNRL
jgi:hypothetical protein